MAYRFIRAQPRDDQIAELHERLDSGEIRRMEPFGENMTKGLENARLDPETGEAVWIEEDYCIPPLAMEREHVLDDYFESITVVDKNVDEAAGWERISDLPPLWDRILEEH